MCLETGLVDSHCLVKCLILLDLDFGVKVFQSNIDGLEALLAS